MKSEICFEIILSREDVDKICYELSWSWVMGESFLCNKNNFKTYYASKVINIVSKIDKTLVKIILGHEEVKKHPYEKKGNMEHKELKIWGRSVFHLWIKVLFLLQ